MGEDKALLPFAGFNTLTEFQLFNLSKIFETVYISCKDKTKFNFEASFIEDINFDTFNKDKEIVFAPTTGFVAVYKKLKDESFFIISVDSPLITKKEIEKIIKEDRLHVDATIAKTEYGIQPMCGVYHRSLGDKFTHMLNDNNHKLGYLLKNSKTNFVFFEDEKPFFNLNYKAEYKEAQKLILV